MADAVLCPVCGEPGHGSLNCSQCGMPCAFVEYFADARARSAWLSVCENVSSSWHKAHLLRQEDFPKQPLLTVSANYLSLLNPKTETLRLYNRFRNFIDYQKIIQMAQADTLYATLYNNGTVTCSDRDLDVTRLRKIRFISATGRAVIAVDRDGNVHARGYDPLQSRFMKWKQMRIVVSNETVTAGIQADGGVRLASLLQEEVIERSQLASPAIDAAVCSGETLILLENGSVMRSPVMRQRFGVNPECRFGRLQHMPGFESGVTALAAMENVILLLGSDGRVRFSNTPEQRELVSQVEAWKDIVLLAAGRRCAAAVDAEGNLHLAGITNLNYLNWDETFLFD